MSSAVALVRCDSYDTAEVHDTVGRAIGLLGGIERFAEAHETIVLKPNLLVGSSPEAAVTTHPAVFRAVAEHLQEAGVHVTFGDSPGFGRTESVACKTGLMEVAEDLSIRVADFSAGREVSFPEGELIKQWFFANGVLDADGIISLPKMKTHGLTRMTCAVKNLFGCIPGIRKGEFHARMKDETRFAQMLVDLNRCLGPRLHVCDAIVAMEGNGPRSGDPRPMNAIIASTDPVALDAVVCRLMNLDVELVDTCLGGETGGLGEAHDIKILGDPVEDFVAEDYDVNRSPASTTGEGGSGRVAKAMRRWVVPKPVIDAQLCTACGVCVEVCPIDPSAVDWASEQDKGLMRAPIYDYDACIRCYCCQEMCPERAIDIKVPPLGRLIHG